MGNLAHMLWFCVSLRTFWAAIARLIEKLTGILNKLRVEQVLLSLDMDIYPAPYRTLVMHILYAAHLVIARKWKSLISPSLGEVLKLVDSYAYEKNIAYKEGRQIEFTKSWYQWEKCNGKLKKN